MMEQEIFKERTIDELRRDINRKAEELYFTTKKSDYFVLLALVILFVGFEALNWHYKWVETNWQQLGVIVCVIVLGVFIHHKIAQHYFNVMKGAQTAMQHLQAAKSLKKTIQIGNVLGFYSGLLFYEITAHAEDIWFLLIILFFLFIITLICFCFKPNAYINKDFCNDIEELEEYKLED